MGRGKRGKGSRGGREDGGEYWDCLDTGVDSAISEERASASRAGPDSMDAPAGAVRPYSFVAVFAPSPSFLNALRALALRPRPFPPSPPGPCRIRIPDWAPPLTPSATQAVGALFLSQWRRGPRPRRSRGCVQGPLRPAGPAGGGALPLFDPLRPPPRLDTVCALALHVPRADQAVRRGVRVWHGRPPPGAGGGHL